MQRRLRERIGKRKFELWFRDNAQIELSSNALVITAESQFAADWIDRHFRGDLLAAAGTGACAGSPPIVRVKRAAPVSSLQAQTPSRQPRQATDGSQAARVPASRTGTTGSHPKERAAPSSGWRRFDDFLVSSGNRLAFESARQVTESGHDPLRRLFLHGSCGVGKTHLLQSICRQYQERDPNAKIRYTTGEQFTNEYIAAIREDSIEQFRRKTRRLDLLVIDDVHFLKQKTATQAECLHTIDAIAFQGARVVMASDEHPRHIARFSAALVSRFLSGMVVKVDDPDRETRIALAKRFALRRGLELTPTSLEALVDRTGSSVREVEGAVMTVAAIHAIDSKELGNGQILIERALGKVGTSHNQRPVRVAEILQAVCTTTGIDREDLVGAGRHRKVVTARGMAAHLARELTTLSFPEIASALGRSSHSTVHAAAARFRSMIDQSETIRDLDRTTTAVDLMERTRREVLRAHSSAS